MHITTPVPARPLASATPIAPLDALLIADTHAAAELAEATLAGFARGLVSTEALIVAGDEAYLAHRRADARWVEMHRDGNTPRGAAEMAEAAHRARRAYSAAARI